MPDSKFDALRQAGTLAHDPNIGTDGLIEKLSDWDRRYGVSISEADANSVKVALLNVPSDLDAFALEVEAFCPDVVHEHFASFVAYAEHSDNPSYENAIKGLDEGDDEFALKAMKRWIKIERTLPLWWD